MSHSSIRLQNNEVIVINNANVEYMSFDIKHKVIRFYMISGKRIDFGIYEHSVNQILPEDFDSLIEYWTEDE
jgi:hypothetical protein